MSGVTIYLARKPADIGEPWISFYNPESLIMDLKYIGFSQVEDMNPEQINARYFKNRSDNLLAGNSGYLMKAQV